MKKWSMLLVVLLELLSNAARANDPREIKFGLPKITILNSPFLLEELATVDV